MKQRLVFAGLFLAAFALGAATIGELKAQGVAPNVSLFLGAAPVSSANPLPVHNQ